MISFTKKETVSKDSTCIRVGETHDVLITRTDEGVVVDIFQLPYNLTDHPDDADATCYSFDREEN